MPREAGLHSSPVPFPAQLVYPCRSHTAGPWLPTTCVHTHPRRLPALFSIIESD